MIPSPRVFEEHAEEYDRWFDEHKETYEAQVRLLQKTMPEGRQGLEIGIGPGRFSSRLGIGHGIDPARPMLALSRLRGTEVVQGAGEHLPYRAGTFDTVLMMTVICFLEDPVVVLKEAHRVLAEGGMLVTGFIEIDGETAARYRDKKTEGRFLCHARFRTAAEVAGFMQEAGFEKVAIRGRSGGICVLSGSRP